MTPQEEMPKFYNSLNLYVCASKTEGTPLTVIEAMAMGIPVISTNVGVVEEALGENGKSYILKERSKDALKERIKNIIANKYLFPFSLSFSLILIFALLLTKLFYFLQ